VTYRLLISLPLTVHRRNKHSCYSFEFAFNTGVNFAIHLDYIQTKEKRRINKLNFYGIQQLNKNRKIQKKNDYLQDLFAKAGKQELIYNQTIRNFIYGFKIKQ